jgi:DNA-binding NarL/FixJ family response regulator
MLATDRSDLSDALRLYLSECMVDVVEVVDDPLHLLARAEAVQPDVVLVVWHSGEGVTARAVTELQRGDHATPVVVLSSSNEGAGARTLGAAAYATLGDPPSTLLETLDEATRKLA